MCLKNTRFGAATASSLRGVFYRHMRPLHGNTEDAAKKCKEILEKKGCPKVAIADLARGDMAEALEACIAGMEKLYWQHRPMTRV